MKAIFTIGVSDTSDIQPPYGDWKVLEDSIGPTGILELKLAEFLEKGETSVSGEEMLKRAKKKGFTPGLRHAKAFLANEDRIPKELRRNFLVFPGTVCGFSGGRSVPFLYWCGSRWCLDWGCLGLEWFGSGRLVVCK